MMDFSPVSMEDFINTEAQIPQIDPVIIKGRQQNSLHRQLLDVWGEVDASLSIYDKWKKGKALKEDLLAQLDCVHNCCYTIYSDEKASDGIKWELKVAEWELYDFTLWDNFLQNNRKSVTLWFDEWCYDTNFEAI
ncbi:MAG: hypothetical protein IJV16_03600 [Lachnospiraceae bacterium]|nr:hypothetical protein [Lachnospiraceae bacterium]MBR1524528.1 hypothetical protein [Lachnospiraceae bacterium]